jgi:hypothetical protein
MHPYNTTRIGCITWGTELLVLLRSLLGENARTSLAFLDKYFVLSIIASTVSQLTRRPFSCAPSSRHLMMQLTLRVRGGRLRSSRPSAVTNHVPGVQ